MFTEEQISTSLQAMHLMEPILQATVIMDQEQLHSDIVRGRLKGRGEG